MKKYKQRVRSLLTSSPLSPSSTQVRNTAFWFAAFLPERQSCQNSLEKIQHFLLLFLLLQVIFWPKKASSLKVSWGDRYKALQVKWEDPWGRLYQTVFPRVTAKQFSEILRQPTMLQDGCPACQVTGMQVNLAHFHRKVEMFMTKRCLCYLCQTSAEVVCQAAEGGSLMTFFSEKSEARLKQQKHAASKYHFKGNSDWAKTLAN